MSTIFNIPGTIITGAGASQELPAQLRGLGVQRVLLVTDQFLEQNGLAARFVDLLAPTGIATRVFSGVQPDPTDLNVDAGLQACQEHGAEAIIALGGGSSLDAAKAIAILCTNPAPLRQYMGYHKIPKAGLPLIAIPTTAGTGSEATKVAVITDSSRDEKMMILDRHMLPTIAIVDYELSMSMPRPLTAHVGVDTLTHGLEAFVSRKASALTDPLALSCIELSAQHLVKAWDNGQDKDARAGMAIAALQGGMAFANSSVCLVHGMSRPLGAIFHVPHGLANAVLLPAVTRYSLPGAVERYAEVARRMGYAERKSSDEAAANALASGLEALNVRLEVPRLGECRGLEPGRFAEVLEKMANDALASGSPQNNPIVPSVEEIMQLYRQSW